MKKLFSLVLVMAMFASVFAVVGCNGLWGFDDDDDVVGPASPNWKLSKKVELDSTAGLNLRAAAATSGYGKLVAKVFNIADRKEMTKDGGIQVGDDGKVILEFLGDANATYTVEISHPTKLDFFMASYFNQLENNKLEDVTKPVNATSTAIAIIASQSKGLGIEFTAIQDNDPLVVKTAVEMVTFFQNAIAAPDNQAGTVKLPETVLVSSVALDFTAKEVKKADLPFELSATVSPSNATIASVSWSSSNDVVSVEEIIDESGNHKAKVTINKGGKATVTVKTDSLGKTATCEVTVIVPVADVAISPETLTINDGAESKITVTVLPEDATVKTVKFEVTNGAEFVSVTADGTVKGLKPGSAVVTVTSDGDPTKSKTCAITVNPVLVAGVKLKTATKIAIDGSEKLIPEFSPAYVTDKSVKWSSDNSSIADVSVDGTVTGKAEGKAVITVTTNDGGFSASCEVTVEKIILPVTSVSITESIEFVEGNTKQLDITFVPTEATNKAVTWKSDDTAIATVNSTGLVTAVGAGTTKVWATLDADSSKTDFCTVKVNPRPNTTITTSITDGDVIMSIIIEGVPNDYVVETVSGLKIQESGKVVNWTRNESSTVNIQKTASNLIALTFPLATSEEYIGRTLSEVTSVTFSKALPIGAKVNFLRPGKTKITVTVEN